MPFLTIRTNADNNDNRLTEDAAKLVADRLGKPIAYVVVTVCAGLEMSFGGSADNKGALIEMKSIGFADKVGLARKLTEFMVNRLNVKAEFVNIEFVDMAASDVAIAGNLLG
ncbi:MAG: hypothetical protein E7010_04510 [Alphaproteobacteria bacterium]|nr:hypothetical protein [Alphaproteobacteria bacterium]